MITAFFGELAAALDGPRRLRRDLLAEVRDGLEDAATAHHIDGRCWRAAAACVPKTNPAASMPTSASSRMPRTDEAPEGLERQP